MKKLETNDQQVEFETLHAQLSKAKGKAYWRSLEELAESEVFQKSLAREFPSGASEWKESLDRRRFLQLMGASLALAGLTACTRQPTETIVPYVHPPEEVMTLGKPLYFATAMPFGGTAEGLLVESHEARPTKIEGNPNHPINRGASSLFAQASVLTLYNPDRARTITNLGEIRPWGAFLADLQQALADQSGKQGAGLRILTETVASPTLANQIKTVLARFPSAKWHSYEPINRDQAQAGAQMALGQATGTRYRIENADVILSLDADFLSCGPFTLPYAREFANRRRLLDGKREMNRLYVAEGSLTNTGAVADNRFPMRPSEVAEFARAIAARLGIREPNGGQPIRTQSKWQRWVDPVARDLQQHRGRSLIIAGDAQPPVVHALAAAMNQALGNTGATVAYAASPETAAQGQTQSLGELAQAMKSGQVDLLVIVGGNPVYTAPADLEFTAAMEKVKTRIHLSLLYDETSEHCHWHIPESHYLESWSDVRAEDGTVTIIQPLIAPLYRSKSAHEFLAAFADQPEQSGYDIVRTFWMNQRGGGGQTTNQSAPANMRPAPQPQSQAHPNQSSSLNPGQSAPPSASAQIPNQAQTDQQLAELKSQLQFPNPAQPSDFEQWWHEALRTGVVETSAIEHGGPISPTTNWSNQNSGASSINASGINASGINASGNSSGDQNALEIIFRPDPSIYDGRFADNGWLQELPKPLTKLTWGNAVEISPATAQRLGLENELADRGGEHGQILANTVELQYKGRTVAGPILIVPGHADDCVTVHLGYGRARAGSVGTGVGFNAYAIRTSDAPWFGTGLTIRKTGEQQSLAITQFHHTMEGRELVHSATLDEFRSHPYFAHEPEQEPEQSLYPNWRYDGHAWGMAIDLNTCTGCNACVVACQSENNIPVVGKEQVMYGREMHWLRIDRYHSGEPENPGVYFQPIPCMHCEKAPCEVVCPVGATLHSSEGLNEMIYNRCVGTRYCSNNCPYKVRRFNFLLYQDWHTPQLRVVRNPDVTVRSRGVMEKCTYCVQRIQEAKITAEKEERPIRDGEIKTACQQTCPTQAIVFGDINDPNSRVAQLKIEPRNYSLLGELNTRPRTTYLAAVRNPNPEIKES